MQMKILEPLSVYERTGFEQGLASGLGAALTHIEVRSNAPKGFAALPESSVEPDMERIGHTVAAREGIALVRVPGTGGTGSPSAALDLSLAAVRLGVVRRMLRLAVERLTGRMSGGSPLMHLQLLQGQVADIAAEAAELSAGLSRLDETVSPMVREDIHARVHDMSLRVTGFFGAEGYIADHPARVHHVSALVANVWCSSLVDRTHPTRTTQERNGHGF